MKKLLTLSVVITTILWTMGVAAFIPVANAAVLAAGDLIKGSGAAVYYYAADGKRYTFPTQSTYNSWYKDFGGVKTITDDELAAISLAGNVVVRPGTNLVKITTVPKVFAVKPNGKLVWVASEAAAKALFGDNWAKKVVDVPDGFWTNYTDTGLSLDGTAYPEGQLIKYASSSDIYYINADGTKSKVADEAAFAANKWNSANVVTAPATIAPATGAAITGFVSTYVDASQGGGAGTGTTTAQGALTVALSASTAPTSVLIYNQANANLASYTFTASSLADVKVTQVKVKRTGVSSDSTLAAVYLYEGNTRLTDNATVSSSYVSWNSASGIFTVPAGQTKTITVVSDISTVGSGTIGISLESAAHVVGNATIAGNFPILGNTMSLTGDSSTLATAAFNATTTPATATINAGETNYTVWKNSTTIGTRAVYLESIRLRQIGSIYADDLSGFAFFVDGVQKATATLVNNYLLFDMSAAPVTLQSGARNLEVRANVVGGSNRTFSFSLQYASDVKFKDSEYGAYVKPTAVPATTGTQTIGTGTLSVTKMTTSPSGNVTKDSSGVTLGKFEFKAAGEPIKVEYLRVGVVESDGDTALTLRNGAVFANGVQVGSTASLASTSDATQAYTDYTLGSSLVVYPGSPVTVEVKADVYDNDGTNDVAADDTLKARILTYTNGGQRQVSLGFLNVPTSSVDGNTLTVKVGNDVTLSKVSSYGSRSIQVPQTSPYKLAEFTLAGSSTEAANLNTITLAIAEVTGTTFNEDDLSDVYVKYGTKETSLKDTVSASNTWSINETLAKSGSLNVQVWGKIGSTVTATHSLKTTLKFDYITADSSTTGATSTVDGQTLTYTAGIFAGAKAAGSQATVLAKANATGFGVASFKFTTTNDSYTIEEANFTIGADGATNVALATLKDGSTPLASNTVNGTSLAYAGLSVVIPANSSKTLTVALDLGDVSSTSGVSGADLAITCATVKVLNSVGTESTETIGVAGNSIYVYKAYPTVTPVSLPSVLLAAGSKTIAKFTVAADGDVEWNKIAFNVSKTANPTLSAGKVYDVATNEEVTGTVTIDADLAAGSAATDQPITFVPTAPELVNGSKTYELRVTIGGTPATNDYVTTNITQPDSHAAPAAYATVAAANSARATFVWSDVSAASHATTTLDWNNGYLVKNLPTTSQTLEK